MLPYAIVSINLALLFYTIGIWSEKKQGQLRLWHLIVFWIGLSCDILGTVLMSKLSTDGFKFNFHGITGLLAIILMLLNALWATIILIRNNEKAKLNFHKFSIFIWLIWLIPFISGAVLGMSK